MLKTSSFLRQWLAVVLACLVPVVFTAFVSLPYALGAHPGEPKPPGSPAAHMS